MFTIPDVGAAYYSRRNALLAEAEEAKSKAASEQLTVALFVTDVTMATFDDIGKLIGRATQELRTRLDAHSQQREAGLASLETARKSAAESDSEIVKDAIKRSAMIAELQIRGAMDASDAEIGICQMIQGMCVMTLELLTDLYTADDRRIFSARLQKFLQYAASNVPVVGGFLDALRTTSEMFAIRTRTAKDADAYMLSLESYVDAGNAYLHAALGLCEACDRMYAGQTAPADADIANRVQSHINAVASRASASNVRSA